MKASEIVEVATAFKKSINAVTPELINKTRTQWNDSILVTTPIENVTSFDGNQLQIRVSLTNRKLDLLDVEVIEVISEEKSMPVGRSIHEIKLVSYAITQVFESVEESKKDWR